MTDETAQPVVEQDAQTPTPEQAQPDATGEKAERVFTKAEVEAMVRDRLAGAQRKAEETAKKAAADAEAETLKRQGEYQKLFEQAQAKLQEAEERAKTLELAGIKRDVAQRLNLPSGLIDRLRGEDESAIEADAKALLAALPKPPAPDINAGTAGGGKVAALPAGMTEDAIREQAIRLGVSPTAYRQQFIRS